MKSSVVKTVLVLVTLLLAFAIAISLSGTLDKDENEYFYISIDYYSNWNATIINSDEIFLKGLGKKEHLFVWPQGNEANITITAYKLDNSINPLTIRIRKMDGTSLGQASTSTPNGLVTMTVKLH